MSSQPSTLNPQLLLRARDVLPLCRPAIHDGAVLVSANRIVGAGRWRDLFGRHQAQTLDLGQVILMPGLVNSHCHLDYTDMAGQFPPPKVFSDWLKLITATKAGWSYSDYAESWVSGAQMLVRTGTTTVADIEAVPDLLPDVWETTPLRVFSFLEMVGIKRDRRAEAVLRETVERIDALEVSRCRAGLSPHAPYSTLPALLRLSAETARQRGWRLCTHVAESALEFEMFAHGRGEMFDWLRRSGRDMSDCGHGSPVQHLEHCGLLSDNLLAVHLNYLRAGDAALLGRRQVHVAHCPRSHAYFGHHPFPLRRLARAGANLCLGTDSLATVYKARRQAVELDLFAEMRALANTEPSLAPRNILRMATVNGARALGLSGQIGELSEGAFADLIAIPFSGKAADAGAAAVHHQGGVVASMIDGRWAVAPPKA